MAKEKSLRNLIGSQVIRYFRADKDEVMANETVQLEWAVENTRRVNLDGMEQTDNSSKTFITSPHEFRLSAYGRYGRSTEYLQVGLHKPQILLLESDVTQLTEGKPVNITFRFRFGLNWKLTADYQGRLNGESEQLAAGTVTDGYALSEQTVRVLLKDMATIRLQVRNGSELTIDMISLGKRTVSVRLYVDPDKVVPGGSVRITWDAAYAKELWLSPGQIDLNGLRHYDMVINGDRDVQLEITANGDFGDQARDFQTVLLARINSFGTSNNGDPDRPEFYLNWFTMRFWKLRLLPENVPVNDEEDRRRILPSGPDTYTLTGMIHSGEETSKTIHLTHCHIGNFELENGKAMIGTSARLHWSVTGARSLRLVFAGELLPVDLAPDTTAQVFQVFKDRDQVTLIAWGDLNVMTISIPIPRFTGPEIKAIRLLSLDLQLGIRWVSSPPLQRIRLSELIRSLRQRGGSGAHFTGLWRWLLLPLKAVRNPRPKSSFINLLKSIYYGPIKSRRTNR